MERNIIYLWICALVIVHPVVHGNQETSESPLSEKLPSLLKMNNDLAFDLYKRLVELPEYKSKNIFFSPFSIAMAISELTLGAGGDTKNQILNGIGYNSTFFSNKEMHELFHSLLEEIDERKGVDIDVGTAVYASEGLKVIPEFFEKMKDFYHSDGFTVNFGDKSTVDKINTYVKEKTHGKIDKTVEELDTNTVMFLLTYIYFKGKWDMPFNPSKTSEGKFHLDDTTSVPVQMMHQSDFLKFHYDMDLSTKVLCLDYNDSFAMFLAVPDHVKNKTITDLENAASTQQIEKWRKSFFKRKIDIYVPKLSLKSSYTLNDVLKQMGMTDMFSGKADFSGISEDRMMISEVMHKASLDMDEEGTTAAAVTTVEFSRMSLPAQDVRFDRPFMVFIVDQKNDNILFFGKVVNPTD
ncbi:alpha-1-antiproteinase [Misgurnus anguillicaudatus]|uniref:alpha-1-antiproteinase n=1 Tax=Misgurnus anguillicaudatus TaxID=75329 RepID=UPI003CCF7986